LLSFKKRNVIFKGAKKQGNLTISQSANSTAGTDCEYLKTKKFHSGLIVQKISKQDPLLNHNLQTARLVRIADNVDNGRHTRLFTIRKQLGWYGSRTDSTYTGLL
jgi:hypothetical protein